MYKLTEQTITSGNKQTLRLLCKQLGIKNYSNMNNFKMRSCINNANFIKLRNAKLKAIKKVEPVNDANNTWLSMLAPIKMTAKPVKHKQPTNNGIAYPKAGNTCFAIWKHCEKLLNDNKLQMKFIIEFGNENNINHHTCRTQFMRFKNYYGLVSK